MRSHSFLKVASKCFNRYYCACCIILHTSHFNRWLNDKRVKHPSGKCTPFHNMHLQCGADFQSNAHTMCTTIGYICSNIMLLPTWLLICVCVNKKRSITCHNTYLHPATKNSALSKSRQKQLNGQNLLYGNKKNNSYCLTNVNFRNQRKCKTGSHLDRLIRFGDLNLFKYYHQLYPQIWCLSKFLSTVNNHSNKIKRGLPWFTSLLFSLAPGTSMHYARFTLHPSDIHVLCAVHFKRSQFKSTMHVASSPVVHSELESGQERMLQSTRQNGKKGGTISGMKNVFTGYSSSAGHSTTPRSRRSLGLNLGCYHVFYATLRIVCPCPSQCVPLPQL